MATSKDKSLSTYVVTQSNELIEGDYSNSKLTANAMKIAKLVIAKLSPDDADLRLVRIKNSTIREYLGYKKGSRYNRFQKDLDSACERLNEQAVKVIQPSGNPLNAYLLSSWEIDNATGEVEFEISGKLKPFLLQLKSNYTSYQLRNIPKLTSTYSIRFYELLSQYRKIGKRQFELEDLKRKVGSSYTQYGHFKKKALLLAQEHLLLQTDLKFEFEEVKTGRKISHIVFYIYPNDPASQDAQQVLPFLDEEFTEDKVHPFSKSVADTFRNMGISDDNLDKMLGKGFAIVEDEERRKKAISRCRTIDQYFVEKLTLLLQSKSRKNPAGFFIKAVKEDWASPTLFKKKVSPSGEAQRRKKIKDTEKRITRLNQSIAHARLKAAETYFKEHPSELLQVLEAIMNEYDIMRPQIKPLLASPEGFKDNKSVSALVTVKVELLDPQSFAQAKKLQSEADRLKADLKAMQ